MRRAAHERAATAAALGAMRNADPAIPPVPGTRESPPPVEEPEGDGENEERRDPRDRRPAGDPPPNRPPMEPPAPPRRAARSTARFSG